ncbi:fungal specific transcription factor, putative [Talaromyces stipitatus ATCC 10500]|uniref:Fungal specific transcription factor, putative n=1 Tax=Talaromyces stipitatus (strain ATCC 10500 / CBS 375.48 / QM 6759 / NRRL 1006) TaxID=441959 RepID=B8MID9_TALSN|nr:fungal specific transcription factor, putative [Talaromyces stipitatus ATCC 10500]EED14623.1 fungal specific transcription factor, putative [Talaromyces stipitatus ATCC 10500]
MKTPGTGSSANHARYVCRSCKTRKRKCNKALPGCSSCSKRNVTCEYSRPNSIRHSAFSSASSDLQWNRLSVDEGTPSLPEVQAVNFPTLLFLDPSILQHGHLEIPSPATSVPQHILRLIGDLDDIHTTASKFFDHIHLWMPFISRKRFYDIHIRTVPPSKPDVILLLLCLKLITSFPPANPRDPRTPLYHAAKHFFLDLEGDVTLSLLILQAGVLLALYEIGHGIYPAAFLTIGTCARYAHALGISVSRAVESRKVITLVELEERRRVWWAIVILDRFVSIGCPGRPFVTAEPELDELLPADDAAWDRGVINPDNLTTLSEPLSGHMSRFALLCQAARLLGQVLLHLSSDSVEDDNVWMQLDRTLQSMLAASLDVDVPDDDQIGFIYSTLVALHTPWLASSSGSNIQRSLRAREVMQQITARVKMNLSERQCFVGRNPDDMSHWGLFFAYRICAYHICSRGKKPLEPDLVEMVRSMREAFSMIDVRWNVAGVYLKLLEAQEAMSLS